MQVRNSILESVLLAYSSALLGQGTGVFVPTGSMITARAGYAATFLHDGKVLFVGGYQSDDMVPIPSAELYDPATGSFVLAGQIRWPHGSTTLLADGRVLLAGRSPGSNAEMYDPGTNTVSVTGEEVVHIYGGQPALLTNGMVFMGGYPTAQIYNPRTGTFSAAARYAEAAPGIMQSVTLLADGRVLLTGAVNVCYQPLCREPGTSWAEIYDPPTGSFRPAGKMNWWNSVYKATLMMNGKVLFTGGDTYNGIPSTAEVFDPSDGSFTSIPPPASAHSYGAATLMPDGAVLLTGGLIPGGQPQDASDLYDPASQSFSFGGRMVVPRISDTSTLLPDGSVLIVSNDAPAELYRPVRMIPAPALFTVSTNSGPDGAIWHAATGQLVSSAAPASAGEIVSMYVDNMGTGSVIPPQVVIGGQPAEIQFFGDAPGYPGVTHVNLRVPQGVTPDVRVPVRLVYLGRASNQVTMALQ